MEHLDIKNISDKELVSSLKSFRKSECTVIAEIVRYLAEVDARQGFRELGFSSLFVFCTEGLGYSAGSAHRRITAARSFKDNPEVYSLLKEGKISLCALSEVAKVITPQNKSEVLTLSQGIPKLEAQKLAARYLPPSMPKRETVRAKQVVVERRETSTSFSTVEVPTPIVEKTVVEERFSPPHQLNHGSTLQKFSFSRLTPVAAPALQVT